MLRRRTLSALFISASVGLTLSACGGAAESTPAPAPTPAPTPAPAPAPAPAPTPTPAPAPAPTPTPAPAPAPTPTPAPAPAPTPTPAPAPAPTPSPSPSAFPCPPAAGRTLTVGPTRTLKKLSDAAAVAQNGDTILVDAGQYVGDVASWNANNLTICGVGGRASLVANGMNAQGKGIWVVGGPATSTMTIVNVEFHGATVPDQNGAGIRLDGGNLVLRNTGFYDGENGILGGEQGTTVTIEYSEFARNGFGDGFTHNLYIGFVDRLTVRASYFHHAKIGHNLKSRGKENVIEDSYFLDGTTGTSSYLVDIPNGGILYMRGNLLQKGPLADNSILISYRAEPGNGGINWAGNTVTMVHNTLVSTYSGGAYLYGPPGTLVTMTANLFAGSASLSTGGPTITQANNKFTTADGVPNAPSVNFWPTATLLSQLGLATIPDPQYVSDAPQPMSLRTISGTTRLIGALQSAP